MGVPLCVVCACGAPRPSPESLSRLVVEDLWGKATWGRGPIWGPFTLWGSEMASRRVVTVRDGCMWCAFGSGLEDEACFGVHVQGSVGFTGFGDAAPSVRAAAGEWAAPGGLGLGCCH